LEVIDDHAVFLDNLTRAWTSLVPRDYVDAELVDLDPPVRAPIEGWLRQLTDTATDPSVRGPNLVLVGPIGAGKTHAAFAAMRQLFFEGTPSYRPGRMVRRSFRYWSVPAALARLRTHDREVDVLRELTEARVLLLDDIGTSKATDWSQEQLFNVFNARRTDLRPTVATTNLDVPELERHLGPAAYSRLVGDGGVVHVKGRNRREPPTLTVVGGP
jgi:DNA replication protein DnaC